MAALDFRNREVKDADEIILRGLMQFLWRNNPYILRATLFTKMMCAGWVFVWFGTVLLYNKSFKLHRERNQKRS